MPDSIEQIPNFRRVSDALGTSGQPNEAQLAAIAREGFEAVINLALHDARYSLKDEAGTVAALGMYYVHIPVQWAHPTRENLLAFYAAMDRYRNRRVWVHCAANMWVTAFLGLYWATQLGQGRTSAFALMDGLWKPNDVWAAFINENLRDAR